MLKRTLRQAVSRVKGFDQGAVGRYGFASKASVP